MKHEEILEKATPRAWRREGGDFCPHYITSTVGELFGVAMMDGPVESRLDNSQLIVLAVNAYEPMMQALATVVYAPFAPYPEGRVQILLSDEALAKIKAAYALARGEK